MLLSHGFQLLLMKQQSHTERIQRRLLGIYIGRRLGRILHTVKESIYKLDKWEATFNRGSTIRECGNGYKLFQGNDFGDHWNKHKRYKRWTSVTCDWLTACLNIIEKTSTNAWPPKISQKSLRPKLVPILPSVSAVRNLNLYNFTKIKNKRESTLT